MLADGSLFEAPIKMTLVLAAIILSAASANALNQFIDRDIDAIMDRTRKRRPLPLQHMAPWRALVFALFLGLISNLYLWFQVNPLSAILSVATILFYIFVYTLWLKRRHYYNIVIGGAAGATAPLIASAAAFNQLTPLSWVLFGIIFTWTPPHFWALALALKDEYESVKIPMLPNVFGEKRTQAEIVIYTILLLPLGILPYFFGMASIGFVIASILLFVWYAKETWVGLKTATKPAYKKLFFVSIAYLFFLFMALGLDGTVRWAIGQWSTRL
jgi:protoheme IX farnesyltransferase